MCGKTIDAARPGLAPVSPRDRSRVATSAAEEPHCRAGPLPPRDFSLWSRPPHPPGSRRGFNAEPGCTQPLSRRSDSSGGWAGGGPARAVTGEEGCAQRGRGTMYGGARGRRLPGRRDSCRGGRDSADPCLKCAPQDLLVSPAGEGTPAAPSRSLGPHRSPPPGAGRRRDLVVLEESHQHHRNNTSVPEQVQCLSAHRRGTGEGEGVASSA